MNAAAGNAIGLRVWAEAVVVAALVFAASCLIERPARQSLSFGATYEAMAAHPFAFAGWFPHRVLLPAIAHVLELTGDRFYLASHGTAVLLLVVAHFAARRFGCRFVDAMLVTTALGFSGAVQTYKSHVGYPDSLNFTFLLASLLALRHTVWFWAFQALSLFTHEQSLFFVPFLLLVRRHRADARLWRDLSWLAAIGMVYAAFRVWVMTMAPQGVKPDYYFGNGYFPLGFLGVLYLAMMWAVLSFGPTLPLLGWLWVRRQADWERSALLLLVAGIVGIYAVAHDFNRFVNFLFLPLLGAQVRLLRERNGRYVLLGMITAQVLVWLEIQPRVTQMMFKVIGESGCLTGKPADLALLVTWVLPRTWPAVLLCALALVALLGAGAWLGRRARMTTGSLHASEGQ